MKAKVYDLKGSKKKEIDLPTVFNEEFRPDLIKKAFVSEMSYLYQPYGSDPMAGKRKSVEWHKRRQKRYRTTYGKGMSRTPRSILAKIGGGFLRMITRGAFVPMAVGGRRAHPPRVEKNIIKKINRKEELKAIRSAISATANLEIVKKRGHVVKEVPIIFEDKIEDIKKTKEIVSLLKKVGLDKELERASKKTTRGGIASWRGRRYKKRKGPLFVFSKFCPALKTVESIPGVESVVVDGLDLIYLAPGSHPGRLTIWSESAIEKIKKEGMFQ